MARALDLFKEYWKPVLLLAVGLAVASITGKNARRIISRWEDQKEDAEKALAARQELREKGLELTLQSVKNRYRNTIRQLDAAEILKHERLRNDPAALVRSYSRLARRLGK